MAAPVLKYATKLQVLAVLRERYKAATREEVWRLAAKLIDWYTAGYITDANLKTMFGVTDAQLPALKTRIQAAAAKWADLQAAAGE